MQLGERRTLESFFRKSRKTGFLTLYISVYRNGCKYLELEVHAVKNMFLESGCPLWAFLFGMKNAQYIWQILTETTQNTGGMNDGYEYRISCNSK